MKALTIKQPWASLIINGHKTYELRSWKTTYRGKILIHTSKQEEKKEIKRFENYNLDYINSAIIGEAEITDCIKIDEAFYEKLNKLNKEIYKIDNYENLYAWKLENIKKYEVPIYTKGKLGLWNYKITEEK